MVVLLLHKSSSDYATQSPPVLVSSYDTFMRHRKTHCHALTARYSVDPRLLTWCAMKMASTTTIQNAREEHA
jgi:hypothetical protein